jgi:DNA-binding transcriptional LysR family regulator
VVWTKWEEKPMDRIDALTAFIAAADESSLAGAARRLGRSPAAVTRAIVSLERRIGTRLLHRTTRVVRLTEAGEQYLAACRRIVADLEEADRAAAGERTAPRGVLRVTAPLFFGRLYVRPLVDAFLDRYPSVQVRLLLLDRAVNVIDEGMDVAVRIGHLPDSSLIAVKVGDVRRLLCASPGYLARQKAPHVPADLKSHECISFNSMTPSDVWTFAPGAKEHASTQVRVFPRLTVNEAEAVIGAAVDGQGVVRVLSYQVERELKAGRLKVILEDFEPTPWPVNVVYPEARLSAAKVRAFVDLVTPGLRKELMRIHTNVAAASSRRSRTRYLLKSPKVAMTPLAARRRQNQKPVVLRSAPAAPER